MNNKWLKAVFIVLFIVLIGEIVYLASGYFSYKPKANNPPLEGSDVNINKSSEGKLPKNEIVDSYLTLINEKLTPEQANFYQELFIMNYVNPTYRSSTLENELEGTISNISAQKGTFNSGLQYDFKFNLTLQNVPKDIFVFFTADEMSKIKVSDETDSESPITSLSDLKNGDYVIIKEKFDLKNVSLIESNIIKLSK